MLAEYDEAYLQGHRLKPLQIHMSQSMARHPTFPIWSMEAEAPQKLGQSHWCVPFTATFSKRRKIGAFWSERCDGCIYTFCISVPCQILTAHSFLVVPITLCSYAWHNCMRCPERERERERKKRERERGDASKSEVPCQILKNTRHCKSRVRPPSFYFIYIYRHMCIYTHIYIYVHL